MSLWNRLIAMRKGSLLVACSLMVCVMVTACSEKEKTASQQNTAKADAARHDGAGEQDTTVSKQAASPKPRAGTPAATEAPATETIAELRTQIELASNDSRAVIELRRILFHRLRQEGQLEAAMVEFAAILDDAEREYGPDMAQRVAASDAGALEVRRDYKTAIHAYDLLLERYGDGRFAAEAVYHQGICQLELQDYPGAERTWQRLIEQHDASSIAPWGWRKLALVQTLQGRFDDALGTLDMIAAKYAGSHYGDYARMRKGYVQRVAGRYDDARASYGAFLASCGDSKYRRLAAKQLEELEAMQSLAQANAAHSGG